MSKEPTRIPRLHITPAQAARWEARAAREAARTATRPVPPEGAAVDRAALAAELRRQIAATAQRRNAQTLPAAWVHADGEMTGLARALALVEGSEE